MDLEENARRVADPERRCEGARVAATRAAEAAEAAMVDMMTGTSSGTKPECVRVCAWADPIGTNEQRPRIFDKNLRWSPTWPDERQWAEATCDKRFEGFVVEGPSAQSQKCGKPIERIETLLIETHANRV